MRCKHGMLGGQCGLCEKAKARAHVREQRIPKVKARKTSSYKGKLRTERQFREFLRDVANDTVADGFDLEQCAGDIAECLAYDPDVRWYVDKRMPWVKTRLQWRECLADMIVG